jgi:DNA-binding response OmpR family regulator
MYPDSQEKPMSQIKILIVDDDKEFLELVRIALRVCCPDCQIEAAFSGSTALNLLDLTKQAQPIDLMLIDYGMPQMNGLELALTVRKNWPKTHIVLMSNNKATLEAGANSLAYDDYLVKPFALRELAKVLEFNSTASGR